MDGGKFAAIVMAVIGVAMVTTLILPGRQTRSIIATGSSGFSNVLGTAMGTRR
jgi:hypothetical protein